MENEFLRRRTEQNRPAGIRFFQEDHDLGFDILIDYGPVGIWIGSDEAPVIYVMRKRHLSRALKDLNDAGISYEVNFQLPETISFTQARRLAGLPGWYKSEF